MSSLSDTPVASARASISSLPLELVHHIIKFSLPPLDSRTFHERYRTLRRLVLVNAAWARLARTELNRHISLSRAGYDTLFASLREYYMERPEAGGRSGQPPRESWKLDLVQRASTIRLKAKENPWTVAEVQKMLQYLPNVSEVRVGHAMSDPYISDYLGSSAFALSLSVLHLTTTLLTLSSFSPAADVFPNLAELVLESPCSLVKAMDFLEYASFPALRTLALLSWRSLEEAQHGQRFESALRHLAPNLHRFVFDCSEQFFQQGRVEIDNSIQLDLNHFTSLRHLSITLTLANINLCTLKRLPSPLSTLRLLESFLYCDEELFDIALNEWPKCMATVKTITLPEVTALQTRYEWSQRCIPKGILVEYRDTTDFD